MNGMRSFAFSTSRIWARVGAYSGRAISSFCDSALRSRTQASALSPWTSSSQRNGSSAGAAVWGMAEGAMEDSNKAHIKAARRGRRKLMVAAVSRVGRGAGGWPGGGWSVQHSAAWCGPQMAARRLTSTVRQAHDRRTPPFDELRAIGNTGSGCAVEALGNHVDRAVAVADPDAAVLHGHLQLHRALCERAELLALFGRHLPDRQVARPGDLVGDAGPPDRRAGAEAVDADPARARHDPHQALVVGLADLDPVVDLAGEVLAPQARLVDIPQVLGEFEPAVVVGGRNVEREREQPDHHPLVGFRWVAGERHRMVGIDLAVHVGELDVGFVDGGFECHGHDRSRIGD